jgi:hypothetical protein
MPSRLAAPFLADWPGPFRVPPRGGHRPQKVVFLPACASARNLMMTDMIPAMAEHRIESHHSYSTPQALRELRCPAVVSARRSYTVNIIGTIAFGFNVSAPPPISSFSRISRGAPSETHFRLCTAGHARGAMFGQHDGRSGTARGGFCPFFHHSAAGFQVV